MIKRIEHWALNRVYPTFDDRESMTAIELIGKCTTKINEIVNTVNEFIDEVNKEIDDFVITSTNDYNTFKVAMEQKFQDFIDIIDLKCKSQDKHIEDALVEIKTEAMDYVTNVLPSLFNALLEEIRNDISSIENRVGVLERTEYSLQYDADGEGVILIKTVSEVNE